MIYSF